MRSRCTLNDPRHKRPTFCYTGSDQGPGQPGLTVMVISFRTNWSGQTVQTQIRLLLDGSSLIAIPFAFFLMKYPKVWTLFEF